MKTIIALVSMVFSTTAFAEKLICEYEYHEIYQTEGASPVTKKYLTGNHLNFGWWVKCNSHLPEKHKNNTPVFIGNVKFTEEFRKKVAERSLGSGGIVTFEVTRKKDIVLAHALKNINIGAVSKEHQAAIDADKARWKAEEEAKRKKASEDYNKEVDAIIAWYKENEKNFENRESMVFTNFKESLQHSMKMSCCDLTTAEGVEKVKTEENQKTFRTILAEKIRQYYGDEFKTWLNEQKK